MASTGGVRGGTGLGVYNLTKAALIMMTRQLASEIGPTRVVGLAPGLVDTDFSGVLIEHFGNELAAKTPVGRLGRPDDVASFAAFLVSDQAGWISGDTFVLDGGVGTRAGE
jgi:NAD(P)-dependent dehydrogenase (short-subunit alcohol dehydrogenase family)